MLVTVLLSAAVILWILFAAGLYVYQYFIEVILDLPLTGQQSPCTAHAALKQFIEKLLQEALNMPVLQRTQHDVAIPPDLNNRTYEDLLATAILNKVISNSQNARPSSSAASVSSRLSNSSNIKDDKEYFFGEETLDNKWKHTDIETTSLSSLDDWLQSDSSFGSRKFVDRVTLTIKQDIEEVSQISESDKDEDDKDSEYFKSRSSIWSDDEPNWFLQKRQFRASSHSPVPVPMLVPNPTTEAKVFIGDKEIDETSDLSDVESEFGDAEIVPAQHSLLINSKSIIGGKILLQNGINGVGGSGESGSESSADSGVKEVYREHSTYDESDFMENLESTVSLSRSKNSVDGSRFISRADIHIDDDNVEDALLLSVYSNTEQEAEYTEQYASLPRKIEKRPQPPARPSLQKAKIVATKNYLEKKASNKTDEEYDKDSDEEVKRVQMHFSGSYSRREKEKWKNAIEMKNNPYSKENIEKRIRRSNSGAGSLFGPDYYVKLASTPSGKKKSSRNVEVTDLSWPVQKSGCNEDIDRFVPIEENEDKKHMLKMFILSEEENNILRAEQILLGNNDVIKNIKPEEIAKYKIETNPAYQKLSEEVKEQNNFQKISEPEREKSIKYVAEVTSDSDLSCTNFYDVKNSQVYKKSSEKIPESLECNGFIKNVKFRKHQKFFNKIERTPSLRRYKSESDLYDHSDFDIPPKILPKKKDNTLISKIYKVLSKSDLMEPPAFRTQLSNPDYTRYDKNHNKYFYGSQEAISRFSSVEVSNNTMTITKKMSLSSEDENSDKSYFYSEYRPQKKLSSSSEDILTVDEVVKPKKKDNNLISKIYNQPQVRNFISNRQQVPVGKIETRNAEKVSNFKDEAFIKENSSLLKSYVPSKELNAMIIAKKVKSESEIDVNELAKKRIVHNLLDKISHSNSRLRYQESNQEVNGESPQNFKGEPTKDTNGEHLKDTNKELGCFSNGEEITTSVRDLMKKFESNPVFIYLWYMGHQGVSFRDVSDIFDVTISSLHRVIHRITMFLSNLSPEVIKWPIEQEKQISENHFRANGFPNVIGAIDGTHIKLDKPENGPDSYLNRKGYYSIQEIQKVTELTKAVNKEICEIVTNTEIIIKQNKIFIHTSNRQK